MPQAARSQRAAFCTCHAPAVGRQAPGGRFQHRLQASLNSCCAGAGHAGLSPVRGALFSSLLRLPRHS